MSKLSIVFGHVLFTSLTTSILIVVYILVKKFFSKQIGVRYQHIIWMIIILRLLVPVSVESPISITSILSKKFLIQFEEHVLHDSLTKEDASDIYTESSLDTNEVEKVQPLNQANNRLLNKETNKLIFIIISRLWLIGIFLLGLFYLVTLYIIKYKNKNSYKDLIPELEILSEECKKKAKITKSIPIYLNSYYKSPCIFGVFNPHIYLPENIYIKTDVSDLRYIILHEMAHCKRKDILFNYITLIAVIIHWFNPLLWLTLKDIRHTREAACDAYVLELIEEDEIFSYGMTIIKSAKLFTSKLNNFSFASFYEVDSMLERRIRMIKIFKKGSYKASILTVILIIFIFIGCIALFNPIDVKSIWYVDEDNEFAVNAESTKKGLNSDESIRVSINDNINEYNEQRLVLIDPGHGGIDPGAIYSEPDSNEINEKDINLEISLELYEQLLKSGVEVKLTRQDDITLSLADRMDLVNQFKPCLFLSIHHNASNDKSKSGSMILYNSSKGLNGLTGMEIAQIINKEVAGSSEDNNSKILKMGDRLKYNSLEVPAVIIEPAYITNSSDRKMILSEEYKDKVVGALEDSILKVLEEMKTE